VKSGTIFDNILLTDSVADAKAHAEATWAKTTVAEKAAKEALEKKEAEEAAKNAAAADEDDEDEEKKEKDEL